MDSQNTDVAGVSYIQYFFAERIGWTLRNRYPIDIGIDADVEQKKDGIYTGKHIALQIKSGTSYLKVKQNGKITFIIDDWHFKYWLSSDRPVIILFFDPKSKNIYWEQVKESYISQTKKNHKIEINTQNILSEKSIPELEDIITTYIPKNFQNQNEEIKYDYALSCFEECAVSMEHILINVQDYISRQNELTNRMEKSDITSLTSFNQAFCKTCDNFRNRISNEKEILIPSYHNATFYLNKLVDEIKSEEKEELKSLIEKHIGLINKNISIWEKFISDMKKGIHSNIPLIFQRSIKNCITVIKDFIYSLQSLLSFMEETYDKLLLKK